MATPALGLHTIFQNSDATAALESWHQRKNLKCNLTSLGELTLGRETLLSKATLFGGVF